MGRFALLSNARAPRPALVRVVALLMPLLATGVLPAGTAAATNTHRATLPGVTLLRPVGTRRRAPTSFDASADLRIEIFYVPTEQAVGDPIGPSFATSPTGGDKPIQVIGTDGGRGKYRADWPTADSHQVAGAIVRVEIRLATAASGPACNSGPSLTAGCVGFFDVGLHKRGHPIVFPDGVRPVTLGKTLPIKFHIAQGALATHEEGATQLTGDPDSPAADAVPNLDFPFSADDYAPDPDLGGLTTSFDTLFLVFKLDTTVAQANDLLAQIGAHIIGGRTGRTGDLPGILYIRVPTTSPSQMAALLAQLRTNPIVQTAVQDAIIGTTETPKPPVDPNDHTTPLPDDWSWTVQPNGGNWGLEAMRVPQMWNLNDALQKQGREANIGVLDGGFYMHHPDLVIDENLTATPAPGASPTPAPDPEDINHGTHVSGTIAAEYNNGLGTDGVDPYTHLVVDTYSDEAGWGLFGFLEKADDLDIVNLSLGYNWYEQDPPVDPAFLLNPAPRDLVEFQAQIFELWEALRELNGHTLPLIVAAAGNDSGDEALNGVDVDARWNSPWDYAGLVDGTPNVLVVEAVGLQDNGDLTRASFSNLNGNVSAPGVDIESTGTPSDPIPYRKLDGTSMATPHVAGLAGYLKSLDPTLTPVQLKYLLISTANPVGGGASPMVDAFDAAMSIDSLRNDTSVLTRLLDIDDGTVDGNLRRDCSTTCAEVTTNDFDIDGGPGDGSVDMSDFRRWRDWLLQMEAAPGLDLDGAIDNVKKDVNHDGSVDIPFFENVYPRGDFNGDGILSRTATRYVRGHVDAVDTDLEVLQTLFSDPDYSASQLPNLIDSGDLHVDTSACMTDGIDHIRTKIIRTDDDYWNDGINDQGGSHEYTEPVDSAGTHWTVRVEAFDTHGNVAKVAQQTFLVKLGGDYWFAPTCGNVTLTPSQLSLTMNVGESTTPSVELAAAGIPVSWEFTNSVANVEPLLTGGSLAANDSVALDPTVTCPATPGNYGGILYMQFTDDQGASIKSGVPEYLAVDLVCLKGGVEADPNPLTQTLPTGASTQDEITLKNNGTALDYEAQAGDHVAIDDGASGELAKQGQAVIKVTLTCPDQPGTYKSTVALTFTRADGKPVTVDHPDSVEVDLECVGVLLLDSVDVENAIEFENLDRTWEQYWSRDEDGTAEHNQTTKVGSTTTNQHEIIDPIGWGDVSSSLGFSSTVQPPPPGFEWQAPFVRAGTMSGNGSVQYTSSYDGTTATWGADFAFDYTTTRPPPNPDIGQEICGTFTTRCSSLGASSTTYFEVTANTQQHVVITYTCASFDSSTVPVGTSGDFGRILLYEMGVGGETLFDSNDADECGYDVVLGPGKYAVAANMGLQSGASDSTGPVSGTYAVTVTMVPQDGP